MIRDVWFVREAVTGEMLMARRQKADSMKAAAVRDVPRNHRRKKQRKRFEIFTKERLNKGKTNKRAQKGEAATNKNRCGRMKQEKEEGERT